MLNRKTISYFTLFLLLFQLIAPLSSVLAAGEQEVTVAISVSCKSGENWTQPKPMLLRTLILDEGVLTWHTTIYKNAYCNTEEKLTYTFDHALTRLNKDGFVKNDVAGKEWSKIYTSGEINETLSATELEGTATSYTIAGTVGNLLAFNLEDKFDKINPLGSFKLTNDKNDIDALNTPTSTVELGTELIQKYTASDNNNGVDIETKISLNGIQKVLYHEYKGDANALNFQSASVPLENYFEESELPSSLPFDIHLLTTIQDQAGNKISNEHVVTITEVNKQPLRDALNNLLLKMNDPKTLKNNTQYLNAKALYDQVLADLEKGTFMFYNNISLEPIITEINKRKDALLQDNGGPVITFPYDSNTEFFVGEVYNFMSGVRAIDDIDGEIQEKQFVGTTPTASQVGELLIKVRSEDKNGNEGVGQVTVNIKENVKEKNDLRIAKQQAETELALPNIVQNLNKENLANKINEADTLLANVNATKPAINDLKTVITGLIPLLTKDTEAPTLTGIGNKSITVGEVFNAKAGVTISDNYDTNPTYTVEGTCLADGVKTCELTYKTQDKYGNTRSYTRTINVVKNDNKLEQLRAELVIANGHINDIKSIKDTAYSNLQASIQKANTLLENESSATEDAIQNLITELQTNNAAIKKDNDGPVIAIGYNPLNDFFVGEIANFLTNVTAEDAVEGNVNGSLNLKTSDVNFNQVGNYTIIIEAKDSKENVTTKEVKVNINENLQEKDELRTVKETADTKVADIHTVHNDAFTLLNEKIKSVNDALNNPNSSKISLNTLKNALEQNMAQLITDNKAPVISNLTPISLSVGESYDLHYNIDIKDDHDDKPSFIIEGDYTFAKVGDYTINYIARDKHGNVSVAYPRTLKVSPNTELIAKLTKLVEDAEKLRDNPKLVPSLEVDRLKEAILSGKETVKDPTTAKKGELERDIRVLEEIMPKIIIDTTPPVITLPYTSETAFFVGEDYDFLSGVKAIDNIDGNVSNTLNPETSLPNLKVASDYTLRISAVDKRGNKGEVTIIITVKEADELKLALSKLKNRALQILNHPKTLQDDNAKALTNKVAIVEDFLKQSNVSKKDIEKHTEDLNNLINKIKKDEFFPLINMNNKSETFPVGTIFTDKDKIAWVTLEDNNPALTPEILLKRLTFTDNINSNKAGTYKIEYTVTDDNENTSVAEKEVILVPNDKKALVIAMEGLEKIKNINVGQGIKDQMKELTDMGNAILNDDNASIPIIIKAIKDINDFVAKFDTDFPPTKLTVKSEKLTAYLGEKLDIKGNITAIDPTDGNITDKVTHTLMGDPTKKGIGTILYSVENSKGRITTKLVEFEIKEKTLPPFDPDAYYRDLYASNDNGFGWSSGGGGGGRGGSYRSFGSTNTPTESTTNTTEEKTLEALKPEKIRTMLKTYLNEKGIVDLLSQEDIKKQPTVATPINKPMVSIPTKIVVNPNSFKNTEDYTAYNYAITNKIIPADYFRQDKMYQPLTRGELAVIVANYSKNVLKRKPHIPFTKCLNFKDLKTEGNVVIKDGMVNACTYGLMGMSSDGVNQIEKFNPNEILTRKDLGTVLSRMLYGTKYDDVNLGKEYYKKHLANLQEKEIIKVNNPNLQELKIWVLLMMQRYSKLVK